MKTNLPYLQLTQRVGAAMLLTVATQLATAQSDNFNDGNDSGWQRYNPIGVGTFSFPDGNSYRIQTAPSPDPASFGQGRAGSVRTEVYANFYISVDIVAWDDTLHQVGGILARVSDPGPGQTKGYMLTHDRGNPSSSTSGDMDIVRLDNEQVTVLSNTSGSDGIHFDPAKQYRVVFIGIGSNFVGQVYELPNTVVPVVSITASDSTYSQGYSGLVVADNSSPLYQGTGDMTFDNFVAAESAPTMIDTFGDGNDLSPLPGWVRYNPIGTGSYSFPDGNKYRLQSMPSPDPAMFGQARVGSLWPGNLSNFYVAVDMVGWDDSIHQIAGVMARINNPGPGTTSGYIFTHDRGNPGSATSGDMDIVRLDGEVPTVLQNLTGSDGIHFDTNKQYRIEFTGSGMDFTGRVYELPDVSMPVLEITASDGGYASGAAGIMAANNREPFYDGGVDVTFDNFRVYSAEPRLRYTQAGPDLILSWPEIIPLVLQSATRLDPPDWTTVTEGITKDGNTFSLIVSTSAGTRWFKLAHP